MHVLIRAFVAALAVAATVATPAASGAIRITKIYYNSPGVDRRSNASLNAEWIRLVNTGRSARQLRGWRISDAAGRVYRFEALLLRASSTVTVHSGDGSDTTANRYWGSGNYIWNNNKDSARLRRADGRLVDSCSYNDRSANSVTC